MRSLVYLGCALLAVHLGVALDLSAWTNEELEDDVHITDAAVFRQVVWLNKFSDNNVGGGTCRCVNNKCSCCAKHTFSVKVFTKRLNYTLSGCMTLEYLKHNKGIKLNFKVNDHELCNKEISLKNPPALCYGIPGLKVASVCLKFHGMSFKRESISGCAKITGSIKLFMIKKFGVSIDLGCFKIPISHDEAHTSRVIDSGSLTSNTQDAQDTDVYFA